MIQIFGSVRAEANSESGYLAMSEIYALLSYLGIGQNK